MSRFPAISAPKVGTTFRADLLPPPYLNQTFKSPCESLVFTFYLKITQGFLSSTIQTHGF